MCFWAIGAVPPSYPCLLCVLTSVFVASPKKHERFPLLTLPYLPLQMIIKRMKIEEMIKLSSCSKKCRQLVTTGRYKLEGFHIRVEKNMHKLEINRCPTDYCDIDFNRISGWMDERIDVKNTKRWFESQKDYVMKFKPTNSIEDIYSMSNWIRSQFKIQYFTLKFYNVEPGNIKSLVSGYPTDGCFKIAIFDGIIDKESLDYVLDTVELDVVLHIALEMPLDFENKKAFSIKTSIYEDGRWVKIEDLKSLRNVEFLNLKRTNFDCQDINNLLRYWSEECDEIMFSEILITLREGSEMNRSQIRDGFTRIDVLDASKPTTCLLAKNRNKKHQIARVVLEEKKIRIQMLEDNWTKPILILIERREQLQSLYRRLFAIEDMTPEEWEQDENREEMTLDERLRTIPEEKIAIETEFNVIVQKLLDLKITNLITELARF